MHTAVQAERRRYLSFIEHKRTTFWTNRVHADRAHPQRLWRSFDQLLGRGGDPSAEIDAYVLHRCFAANVAGVRACTAGVPAPQFSSALVGCELRVFSPVTPYDVAVMVRALPHKQCSSDPLPTRLLKDNVDLLAPLPSHLFCWSLQHGAVPSLMKSA